jgi:hypothetical protein
VELFVAADSFTRFNARFAENQREMAFSITFFSCDIAKVLFSFHFETPPAVSLGSLATYPHPSLSCSGVSHCF